MKNRPMFLFFHLSPFCDVPCMVCFIFCLQIWIFRENALHHQFICSSPLISKLPPWGPSRRKVRDRTIVGQRLRARLLVGTRAGDDDDIGAAVAIDRVIVVDEHVTVRDLEAPCISWLFHLCGARTVAGMISGNPGIVERWREDLHCPWKRAPCVSIARGSEMGGTDARKSGGEEGREGNLISKMDSMQAEQQNEEAESRRCE